MCRLFIMLDPIPLRRHIVYVVVIVLHLVTQGGRCYSFINHRLPELLSRLQQLRRLYSWGSVEPQATAAASSRGGSQLIAMDDNCCGTRPCERARQQNAPITRRKAPQEESSRGFTSKLSYSNPRTENPTVQLSLQRKDGIKGFFLFVLFFVF